MDGVHGSVTDLSGRSDRDSALARIPPLVEIFCKLSALQYGLTNVTSYDYQNAKNATYILLPVWSDSWVRIR